MSDARARALVALALCAAITLALSSSHLRRPLYLLPPPLTKREPAYSLPRTDSCADQLGSGNWTRLPVPASCSEETATEFATCSGAAAARQWRFGPRAARCGARRADAVSARALLAGARIAFVGDSVARSMHAALLRLAGSADQQVALYHSDFEHALPGGGRASFFWRPLPANATALLSSWAAAQAQQARQAPDNATARLASRAAAQPSVAASPAASGGSAASAAGEPPLQSQQLPELVVLSVVLWHLLHERSPAALGRELARLAAAATSLLGQPHGGRPPLLVLLPGPELFPNRMRAPAKRAHMAPASLDDYNRQLAIAPGGLLRSGRPPGPFALLDVHALTHACGEECSVDGVHSGDAVYDAALQVLLSLYRLEGGAQPAAVQGPGP